MLSKNWLKTLQLAQRSVPELITPESNLTGLSYNAAIEKAFSEIKLDAIHCISGVPTIAFLVRDEFNHELINKTHKALWNQGLISLLFFITEDTLRVYSLTNIPDENLSEKSIKAFNAIADTTELNNLILSIESGRFFEENKENLNSKNRIDNVLLDNLQVTISKLTSQGMSLTSAQALLMQVMFISYLEDKGIINTAYYQQAIQNDQINSFIDLVKSSHCVENFELLFRQLKLHFNGDMFVAPCSFDEYETVEKITLEHIRVISDFREGNINLSSRQHQLWPYDFKYTPVDLISAVYDRFLTFNPEEKRENGAYYTPMFLADLVTEQSWQELTTKQKEQGVFVDPSCGSGIFLVRLFEKIIGNWKAKNKANQASPRWEELLTMIKRINGFDIKKEAIRVASFSLYIALLENSKPSELLELIRNRGHVLPKLLGNTLIVSDFFEIPSIMKYDLIIGNPPWVSRKVNSDKGTLWAKSNGYDLPSKEIAWGFTWKALQHVKDQGLISLLLKTTSTLTSITPKANANRSQWLNNVDILKIINLSDIRFQLFENGNAPTSLIMYKAKISDSNYMFDYWTPKADLNLKTKRILTITTSDKLKLPIKLVKNDPLILKRSMWMQSPDFKLFQYVSSFSKLSEKLITYQDVKKSKNSESSKWVIGQGFIKAQDKNLENPEYKPSHLSLLTEIPHLDADDLQPLVMPTIENKPWSTAVVHRKGYERGYEAPFVLIPQGLGGNNRDRSKRLKASYCTQNISFLSSLQTIKFDKNDQSLAKFLTVLLNSSLVTWFLFHSSSVVGIERDKVPQNELLNIPFPLPDEMNNSNAKKAFKDAVNLIDNILEKKDNLLRTDIDDYFINVDSIIYSFFGLNESDICVIEDTVHYIFPSAQAKSHSAQKPPLWDISNQSDWELYSKMMSHRLSQWIEKPYKTAIRVEGVSQDLVIISVHLTDQENITEFSYERNNIHTVLLRIWKALPRDISRNFQLIPDLKIFIDDILYIIKPRTKRFWLATTALADADAIASELFSNKKGASSS